MLPNGRPPTLPLQYFANFPGYSHRRARPVAVTFGGFVAPRLCIHMAANRFPKCLGRLLAACLAVTGLMASEHHGTVTASGLPVPGATVTATNADKKVTTTTDENGVYSFPELADGVWNISIEMLGFVKATKDVGVASDAPAPDWTLKPMTAAELTAALAPKPATPAPTSAAATPPAAGAATTPASQATPAATTADSGANPAAPATSTAQNTAGGRGTNNGRPSIRAAQGGRGSGGFTRLDVNAAGDAAAGGGADNADANVSGDMAQSSNDAFVVNGSISSAAGVQGSNDWGFGGPGGPGGQEASAVPAEWAWAWAATPIILGAVT